MPIQNNGLREFQEHEGPFKIGQRVRIKYGQHRGAIALISHGYEGVESGIEIPSLGGLSIIVRNDMLEELDYSRYLELVALLRKIRSSYAYRPRHSDIFDVMWAWRCVGLLLELIDMMDGEECPPT